MPDQPSVANSGRLPYKNLVIIVSIIVPMVVASLFRVKIEGVDFSFLPPVYATMNGLTALFLILAVWAISKRKIILHRRLVTTAVVFSFLFLVMYILYHSTSDPTRFGGEGILKYVYYFLLITHIILSIIIIPFVLITYIRGYSGQTQQHRKIARITFPLWLYVAVSGVIIYLLISPYYIH